MGSVPVVVLDELVEGRLQVTAAATSVQSTRRGRRSGHAGLTGPSSPDRRRIPSLEIFDKTKRRLVIQSKVFDIIASAGGALVVVVLLVAGGLLMWGYSFAHSSVHDQLAEQQIVFPVKGSPELASPKIGPYLDQYAGQLLTTGPQAQAYANHFIAVHLSEMPDGGVYAKLSAASLKDPKNAKLAAAVETSFKGTTLRVLLLEAYGFWTFGQIAFWAGIATFVLAAVMAVLVGFGFWHARRVPETARRRAKRPETNHALIHRAPTTAWAQWTPRGRVHSRHNSRRGPTVAGKQRHQVRARLTHDPREPEALSVCVRTSVSVRPVLWRYTTSNSKLPVSVIPRAIADVGSVRIML